MRRSHRTGDERVRDISRPVAPATCEVVDFHGLREETRIALLAYAPTAEFIEVDDHAGNNYVWHSRSEGYYWLLHRLWSEVRTFIIVEQDVVIRADTISTLLACEQPWCCYAYQIANHIDSGMLGCTKFDAKLMRKHPDAMDRVGEICDDGCPPRDWHRNDTRILRVLREYGYDYHTHMPPVEHLHSY